MEAEAQVVPLPDQSEYWLVMDASCPVLQVALFHGKHCIEILRESKPAAEALLTQCRALLLENEVPLCDIRGLGYCRGPGSILGIRLCLMTIQTWARWLELEANRCFHFSSLEIAAAELVRSNPEDPPKGWVVSPWKKGHWNAFPLGVEGENASIQVISDSELMKCEAPCYLLKQRKLWKSMPQFGSIDRYDLSLLAEPVIFSRLVSPMRDNEVYQPEPDDFKKWSGQRHTSPSVQGV